MLHSLETILALTHPMVGSSVDILAYLDPGAGSLFLQVVVGAAVGLLVTAKLTWTRLKTLVRSKLSRNTSD